MTAPEYTHFTSGDDANATLTNQVAFKIIDYIERNSLEPGQRLAAQKLADTFNVSRSPVRSALIMLAEMNIVAAPKNRGFCVKITGSALVALRRRFYVPMEDELYLRIAQDRLAGSLPDRVTEAELARRYQTTRSQLQRTLVRMAKEGWAARKPGYGWTFLPVLVSSEAVIQSYAFRMVLEPAAILEPGYDMDENTFLHCHAKQVGLLNANLHRLTPAQVFEIGSDFHEAVVGASKNPYFLDELRRHNRLRRLMEHRVTLDPERITRQCTQHIEILERIEAQDRKGAAELMRSHLNVTSEIKTKFHDEHPLAPLVPVSL